MYKLKCVCSWGWGSWCKSSLSDATDCHLPYSLLQNNSNHKAFMGNCYYFWMLSPWVSMANFLALIMYQSWTMLQPLSLYLHSLNLDGCEKMEPFVRFVGQAKCSWSWSLDLDYLSDQSAHLSTHNPENTMTFYKPVTQQIILQISTTSNECKSTTKVMNYTLKPSLLPHSTIAHCLH